MTLAADNEGAQEQYTDDQQDEQQQDHATDEAGGDDQGTDDQQEEGSLVVSFGEESPPPEEEEEVASPLIKDLRSRQKEMSKSIREKERENAELKQKLEQYQAPKDEPALKKPTLESVDYDEAEYERQFEAYNQAKAKADAKQREKAAAEQAEKDAWQAKLNAYNTTKTALKVADFEDAEAEVTASLNQTQLAIIVNGADNSALLIYALGKAPAKVKELASIKDPVKFAFAVAKLETQVKATPRKAPPAAEQSVRGSGSASSTSSNSELTRLEAEAERTGDRSKVVAYKKRLAAKAK